MTDWQKRRQKTHEQAYKDLPGVSRGAIHSLIERGYRDGQADTLERIKPLIEALEFYAQGGNSNRDVWFDEKLGYFIGKRAREALAKWREEVK